MSSESQVESRSLEERRLEADLAFRREELALRRAEIDAKLTSDRHGSRFSSPLTLAIVSAVFGLLGTGVGAVLQGFSDTRLERQKFEAELIKGALNPADEERSKKNLSFLVNVGLISDPKGKIASARPEDLPRSLVTSSILAPAANLKLVESCTLTPSVVSLPGTVTVSFKVSAGLPGTVSVHYALSAPDNVVAFQLPDGSRSKVFEVPSVVINQDIFQISQVLRLVGSEETAQIQLDIEVISATEESRDVCILFINPA